MKKLLLGLILSIMSKPSIAASNGGCGDNNFDVEKPKISFSLYDEHNDSVDMIIKDSGASGVVGYRITRTENGQGKDMIVTFVDGLRLVRLSSYPSHIGSYPTFDGLSSRQSVKIKGLRSQQVTVVSAQAIDGCGYISNESIFEFN